MKIRTAAAALLMAVLMPACSALAQFDAQTAQTWLAAMAVQMAAEQPKNDARTTADPARPGEFLLEYDFGTAVCTAAEQPEPQEILLIELKSPHQADCMGVSVGQTLEDVIAGRQIALSDTPLYVLSTQESGYGWTWAYVAGGEIYGVEHITYGGDAQAMKEYTLTYVMDGGRITAIRLRMADATQAQAIEGLRTAEEIAGKQLGEVLIAQNDQPKFDEADLTVRGQRVLGVPVEALIALLGEPQEIQALPGAAGRMLVYAHGIAELAFDEMTGVEKVRAIGSASSSMEGPRGILAGMTLAEAAGRLRCDGDMYSNGGNLYLAGEAQGVAPYGEMICTEDGAATLRYTCLTQGGQTAVLDIVVDGGTVVSWNLYLQAMEAAYGG